jgi:hypothetical protein
LCWAFSKVSGPNDDNIALIEIICPTLILLEPLVVRESDPDHLVPAFNDPRFHFDSFGLDVFFGFNVYLPHNRLSLLESRLVESDPYLALWMGKMTQ